MQAKSLKWRGRVIGKVCKQNGDGVIIYSHLASELRVGEGAQCYSNNTAHPPVLSGWCCRSCRGIALVVLYQTVANLSTLYGEPSRAALCRSWNTTRLDQMIRYSLTGGVCISWEPGRGRRQSVAGSWEGLGSITQQYYLSVTGLVETSCRCWCVSPAGYPTRSESWISCWCIYRRTARDCDLNHRIAACFCTDTQCSSFLPITRPSRPCASTSGNREDIQAARNQRDGKSQTCVSLTHRPGQHACQGRLFTKSVVQLLHSLSDCQIAICNHKSRVRRNGNYRIAVPESIGLRRSQVDLSQWLKWEQHQPRYGIIRMRCCFGAT